MPHDGRFDLSASIVLWRGDEILVMKRAGGFSAGGWFIPGGHLEPGERPTGAAARELREETQIEIDPAALQLVDVMSYELGEGDSGHTIIYNGACAPGTEPAVNEEHTYTRWMTPEAFIARFLDADFLRSKGIPEGPIALAAEVARVVRHAAEAWRAPYTVAVDETTRTADDRLAPHVGGPYDAAATKRRMRLVLGQLSDLDREILDYRKDRPIPGELLDQLLQEIRAGDDANLD